MPEFALIDRIRAATRMDAPAVRLGIGDDAALIDCPPGQVLVAAVDTLNEGVHFPAGTAPADLGHKALAVNLSDLAAMGAAPAACLLALSLPEADDAWVDAFARGLGALARRHGAPLAGGDTVSGPLSVTVTALGFVGPGEALRRDAARPGDLVCVSGALGAAALGLARWRRGEPLGAGPEAALHRPEPRVALGRALRGLAHAAIDLSDGLASDLGHVLRASGCGARIDLAALPAAPDLAALDPEERWGMQVSGGDDYELCFTVRPGRLDAVRAAARDVAVPVTVIGEVREGEGVEFIRPGGGAWRPAGAGFEHFGAAS